MRLNFNSGKLLPGHKLFYLIGFLFIAVNLTLLYFEQYWIMLIPFGLFLAYYSIVASDKVLLFIVLCTPLSINLADKMNNELGVYFPTEPLLVLLTLVFCFRVFYDWNYDKRILKHPVTIIIALNLIWIFICSITSVEPIVSFKFLAAKIWFIIPLYFIGTQVFRNIRNLRTFPWLYVIPLMAVVIYTIINHATHDFDQKTAHWVMQPFYNDHTQYGAVLAMFYPFLVGSIFNPRIAANRKILIICLLLMISTGLILSYTRAAWLSIGVALFVGLIIWLRLKFRTVLVFFTLLAVLFFSFQQDIIRMLEQNKQESSSDLLEHAESISNIASDASNLERINRWNSAIRMFLEKPLTGWGPGTYAFYYAPFQNSRDKTIISTNFGDRGNAHSEYLGPLAETGWPGALLMLLLIAGVIYSAATTYNRIANREVKLILISTFLGLVTYFTHGALNNFLDSDKASVPFWGFIAITVACDVYYKTSPPPPK